MGFACKLSPKQAAANLAMALTLAADTKHLSAMTKEYLEFMTMCMTAGLDIDLNIDNYPDTLIPAKSCDHDLDVGNPLRMQSPVRSCHQPDRRKGAICQLQEQALRAH